MMRIKKPRKTLDKTLDCALSAEYFKKHREVIEPFYESKGTGFTCLTPDGINLSYRTFINPNEKALILVLPGRGENYMQYAEVVYELFQQNYSVCLIDHRGQGQSQHLDKLQMLGHIENFLDYSQDVKFVLQQTNAVQNHKKIFILAHSLGGIIATRFIYENPNIISGLILVTPMFGIEMGPLPQWLGATIGHVCSKMGLGRSFVLGRGPADPYLAFEKNRWTHCPYRFQSNMRIRQTHWHFNIGGPSNKWFQEAIIETKKLQEYCSELKIPILLFQAEKEGVVKNSAQDMFCEKVKQCQKIYLKNAMHEVLSETDDVRAIVLKEIFAFLEKN